MKIKSLLLAGGCALMVASNTFAQAASIEFPQPSPTCTMKQRVGLTDVEVVYSRPSMKGRDIFGNVVPYGKVWRTGANAATKITFSTPVKLNGTEVAAGTYALMTIPNKDEWTIIVNKGTEPGPYKYDEKQDVVRFTAKPVALNHPVDAFTIDFGKLGETESELDLAWAKTQVPIKVEVDFHKDLVSQIEKVMASDAPDKPYFQAAKYYYDHNLDMNKAKEWSAEAVKQRDAYFTVYLQANILHKLGDKGAALAAAKHSLELAEKANDHAYIRMNNELISSLK